MQFGPATASITQFDALLDSYGVGFLKGSLGKIKEIGNLANGVFGETIIAELGLMKKNGVSESIIVFKATQAFEIFGSLRTDFKNRYGEQKIYANTPSEKAHALASAYSFAIINNRVGYSHGSVGSPYEAVDGLINRGIDCNVSSYLLIQLGREEGLDMAGVLLPNHYAAAVLGDKGQVAHYIETNIPLNYVTMHEKEHKTGTSMFNNFLHDGWFNTLIDYKDEWERAMERENKVFSLDTDVTSTSIVTFHLKDVSGLFKRIDRENYEKYKNILKNKWMLNEQNFMAFENYMNFMIVASAGVPLIKVDNEKEMLDALKQAKKIFGKEKMDKLGTWRKDYFLLTKILNPVDYIRSDFF
jgi:hypothetical protein